MLGDYLLTRTPWTGFPVALREVAEYLAGQTLEVDVETVNFSLTFPRYVFNRSCLGPRLVVNECGADI